MMGQTDDWQIPEHGEDRNRRIHRYMTDPEYHTRVYAAAQVLPKIMGGDVAVEWAMAAIEAAERAVVTADQQRRVWIARRDEAKAEVVEWNEFGQGYNAKAECVICICGVPYPMRWEHYCPADNCEGNDDEDPDA